MLNLKTLNRVKLVTRAIAHPLRLKVIKRNTLRISNKI